MELHIFPRIFGIMILLSCTTSMIIKRYPTDDFPGHEVIKIDEDLIIMPNKSITKFNQHVKRFMDYSLDHKCKMGLDLSVGFFFYTPYVDNGMSKDGLKMVLSGILPHLVRRIVENCCPKSRISYGEQYKSVKQLEQLYLTENTMDLTFPLYGLQGLHTTKYKDNPFIPLVKAPHLVLLVPDALFLSKNTRLTVLMNTIFHAWPMLVVIFAAASLSGLTIWLCDHKLNPSEFPPSFFDGAWEGFWWAFVTMSTVGYGDRAPKSILGRAFCICWILTGIVLISLFTGLVTASLSLGSVPVFNVEGAKIGAVGGSKEYQVGIGLNSEMKSFTDHGTLMDDLISGQLDGALIDNFILSSVRESLAKYRIRIERTINQPITYGLSLKQNSSDMEKCFRKYVRYYPHAIFETVTKYLKPVRNPTDDILVDVQAAQQFFYDEKLFKHIVYIGVGILGTFLVIGIFWELCLRNKSADKYMIISKKKKSFNGNTFLMQDRRGIKYNDIIILIQKYNSFHEGWMEKLIALGNGEEPLIIGDGNRNTKTV